MATRRTAIRVEVPLPPSTSNDPLDESKQNKMKHVDVTPPFGSPFLPTILEAALLAIYPGTLIIGSLFSTLTVNHERTPYFSHLQSYDPANAPSYFAKKSNVLNKYFVKVGWAWVTIAFALFVASNRAFGPVSWLSAPQQGLTRRRLQAALRWAALTGVWYALTQDFFGSPLIDRGFRYTGGRCEVILSDDPAAIEKAKEKPRAEDVFSHAACRLVGGSWKGGHDISGHVFLLVMGSAMLWLEILPTVLRAVGLTKARRLRNADGTVTSASRVVKGINPVEETTEQSIAVKIALGVAGVSWWMLLMTAAYFHTWIEKTTGLLVAFTGIYLVYFLPRAIPALRQILGMPGT